MWHVRSVGVGGTCQVSRGGWGHEVIMSGWDTEVSRGGCGM